MSEEQSKNKTEEKAGGGNSSPNQAAAPNPLAIPISIVIAGVLVALAIIFSGGGDGSVNKQVEEPTGPSNEEMLELAAIQPDDHVRGDRNAPVYILEFSDTECPFCKQFHNTMKQIQADYATEVAWVYRHFPLAQLHPTAPRESEALECANDLGGEELFWAYTDQIYEQTPQREALADEDLGAIAAQVGLNRAEFETCLNSGKFAAEVQKDVENAIALGGRGTPHSLIIAGDKIVPINGAQPYSVVKASLDAILK